MTLTPTQPDCTPPEVCTSTCDNTLYGWDPGLPVTFSGLITVLGLIQTVTSSLILVFFFLNNAPLIVRNGWRAYDEKRRDRGSQVTTPAVEGEGGGGDEAADSDFEDIEGEREETEEETSSFTR